MILRLLFPILLSGLSGLAAAQNTLNLRGRVLERAGLTPVPGALIRVAGGSLMATTDAKGEFRLSGATGLAPGHATAMPMRAYPAFAYPRLLFPPAPASGFGAPGYDALGSAPVTVRLPGAGTREVNTTVARTAGAATKASAARLDITCDKLAPKSLTPPADTGNLGDIVLEYPPRMLDVGALPAYGAVTLFGGNTDSAGARAELEAGWVQWINPWRASKGLGATPVLWKILPDPEDPVNPRKRTISPCCLPRDGSPEWGYDDLLSHKRFRDFQLHIEFNMYGGPGDAAPGAYTNSGVYLQNRYEIQIETPPNPWDPQNSHGIASIIQEYPPDKNVIRAPGKWQAYDITFRAARFSGGTRTEKALISIWWNGVQVHRNRYAAGPLANPGSGGADIDSTAQGLKLQNEKGLDVRYRNIWVKELNLEKAETDLGY